MSSVKRINLALQGGGSHGAFTWGVLDAGAMNAAIFVAATNVQTDKVRSSRARSCRSTLCWDGCFRGNPPIWPFIYNCDRRDVVLVEKSAIAGDFSGRLKNMLVHSITDSASLAPLGAVSKFNIEPEFLEYLFDLGRKAATPWLASTFASLDSHSTIDIRARFL
jgi:predicted acylesterase/phospholipase RssA